MLFAAVAVHDHPWYWTALVIPVIALWLIWRYPPDSVGAGAWVETRRTPPWVTRLALWVLGMAAAAGFGVWFWLALWGNKPADSGSSDRWLNVMLGLGATAAVMAFLGGLYLSARYGRRASVSISANVYPLPDDGVALATRPVVKAVGIFRVRFRGARGALIRVREMFTAPLEETEGTGLKRGREWEQATVFGEQFAEAGEELATTTVFRLPPLPPSVIGWTVTIVIQAPTRWLPGSSGAWADRIFVPRPEIGGLKSGTEPEG